MFDYRRLKKMLTVATVAGLMVGRGVAAELDLSTLPDPTRPLSVGESEEVHSRGLTSIRITTRQRSAVIDGRSVSVGDTASGGVVQDIRPDEVQIKRRDGVTTLRLMPELKRQAPQGSTAK